MKKIIVLFILMFVMLGMSPAITSADILPPPGFHAPGLCTKIVNLDSFPEIVLVGFIMGHGNGTNKYSAYQIKNNVCLDKGYKFNSLSIYWTTKEKFNLLDLNNLKLKTEKIKGGGVDEKGNPTYYDSYSPADLNLLLNDAVSTYLSGEIPDSNPLISGTLEYKVSYFGGIATLNKSRKIYEYNNGAKSKIETFDIPEAQVKNIPTPNLKPTPTPVPTPEPAKKGFWHLLGCFFFGC